MSELITRSLARQDRPGSTTVHDGAGQRLALHFLRKEVKIAGCFAAARPQRRTRPPCPSGPPPCRSAERQVQALLGWMAGDLTCKSKTPRIKFRGYPQNSSPRRFRCCVPVIRPEPPELGPKVHG